MSKGKSKALKYYEINSDYAAKHVWFLGKPKLENSEFLDVWSFTSGHQLSFSSQLLVPIQMPGYVVDVTFSHYEIPYIQPRVGKILEAFAGQDVQRIPARLENGEEIEILNVITVLDAFDREHSEATYKGSKPNMVMKLCIRSEDADGHHIFRLKDWFGPLIISEVILRHLQRIGATGFTATEVS